MSVKLHISIPFLILFLWAFALNAQEKARVYGKVKDEKGKPIELVNVAISGLPGGSITDQNGYYELSVPIGIEVFISYSFIGFENKVEPIFLSANEEKEVNIVLHESSQNLPVIKIEDKQIRNSTTIRIDPKLADVTVNLGDKVIGLIQTQPGVTSTNEMSSQYSVRGGNFDENLVYVNDIEIYRPFLIRAGQQEGLSFINSDLVSSILFSAGGFSAKYGDKMSSVLDIYYTRPTSFKGAASASLLGGSLYFEGTTKNDRFSYLMGLRRKSNQYLLNSLDTEGEYKPNFTDFQTNLTYQISDKLEISFLGNYSDNLYLVVPEKNETDFGTFNDVKRLTVYFDGQEKDQFLTYLGALTLTYKPDPSLRLKLIAATLSSIESENYDILGQYWLGKVETNQGSEDFDKVLQTEGVGSYLNHARNSINAEVYRIKHLGKKEYDNVFIQWGARYQHEHIIDHMNEWVLIDSAGYSLPRPPDSIGYTHPDAQSNDPFELHTLIASDEDIRSNRITGFIQSTWGSQNIYAGFSFTAGIRAHYWDFNNELNISPRISASYKPAWTRDFVFRLAAGIYHQPPFFREMKRLDGTFNYDIKSQSSAQVIIGSDYNFRIWKRPFKLVTEVYYKYLYNLIPYIVDNVRIRYFGENASNGYATGIDFKLNGEFIPDAESWISLSIMDTREDIIGDYKLDEDGNEVEVGFIPRPTNRLISLSVFFQDYLPINPTYKVSLMMTYASGTPFGKPSLPKYTHTFKIRDYRRADIGFSKEIFGPNTRTPDKSFFKHIKGMYLTAEILNLFQSANVNSYIWIKDIYNYEYPVPNYLTPRLYNIKLFVEF